MRLDKSESRRRWKELRSIVNACDPVGLIACGCPEDEYDCVLGSILRRLEGCESPETISAHLITEFKAHFGTSVSQEAIRRLANEASTWYRDKWPGSTV